MLAARFKPESTKVILLSYWLLGIIWTVSVVEKKNTSFHCAMALTSLRRSDGHHCFNLSWQVRICKNWNIVGYRCFQLIKKQEVQLDGMVLLGRIEFDGFWKNWLSLMFHCVCPETFEYLVKINCSLFYGSFVRLCLKSSVKFVSYH